MPVLPSAAITKCPFTFAGIPQSNSQFFILVDNNGNGCLDTAAKGGLTKHTDTTVAHQISKLRFHFDFDGVRAVGL